MNVTIENLTDKPLWLRLNSGASLSVMPRSKREVPQGEVRGNPKLKSLHDEKVIRTQPPYGDPEQAKIAADAKTGESKKKGANAKAPKEEDEATDSDSVEQGKKHP